MGDGNSQSRDRSRLIFGNKVPDSTVRKAEKTREKYIRKYGFDPRAEVTLSSVPNPVLGPSLGVQNVVMGAGGAPIDAERGIVIGNIRMGFGHYRIAIALASAARSLGFTPYWFDLISFPETLSSKVITHLNNLYSFGSRLSQKSRLFNRYYWEPLNSEGFRKITFNAVDQKVGELHAALCRGLPSRMPFLAAHVWPAQGAVHAGMPNVVNVIADNWPMALHLAEGSLHVVQSPSAYLGYRLLRGMGSHPDEIMHPMPSESLKFVGHYVDHELLCDLAKDCARRLERMKEGKPRRILLTVGGAGAQRDFFLGLLQKILPWVAQKKAVLLLNFGDHTGMWDDLRNALPALGSTAVTHFNDWQGSTAFARAALESEIEGVHAFADKDIFSAVYLTNLLMRCSDVMLTKPSELAYYPVPKLFIKRVGGHEKWGAIRGAELGDGTIECETVALACQVLSLFVEEKDLLGLQTEQILKLQTLGVYNGAYEAVKLALQRRG